MHILTSGYHRNDMQTIYKSLKVCITTSWRSVSEVWGGITCQMGSHSVTCRLTQVNAPRVNPSQTELIYPPQIDGSPS